MTHFGLTIDPRGILPSPEDMSDEITEAAAWYRLYRSLPGWLSLETRDWLRANWQEFVELSYRVQRPPHHGLQAAIERQERSAKDKAMAQPAC